MPQIHALKQWISSDSSGTFTILGEVLGEIEISVGWQKNYFLTPS